jgi:HipA-like protein
VVERERKGRLRLAYTEDALAAYEGGIPLLSLAMPLTRDRYPNSVTRAFLDGLLPEGEPRRAIAADLDLPASDVFGGPTLARIANVLQEVANPSSLETLLRAVTLNVALGNCDAHGKNFSLLHAESGALHLAPLYDLLSTRLYPVDDKLAMYVDNVQEADRVTADRIVSEAARWSMNRSTAEQVVADTLDLLPAAVSAAADETEGLPSELAELVGRRIDRLRESAQAC